jgi:hypothetical protein
VPTNDESGYDRINYPTQIEEVEKSSEGIQVPIETLYGHVLLHNFD